MLLFQAEKQSLEQNLQKTEENLSRQLTYAQQVSLLCSSRSHWPVSMETFPRFHMNPPVFPCTIKTMVSILMRKMSSVLPAGRTAVSRLSLFALDAFWPQSFVCLNSCLDSITLDCRTQPHGPGGQCQMIHDG